MVIEKKLEYLHFAGGFGDNAGAPLRNWELTAVQAAQALHPTATVMLHCGVGAWLNAPAGAVRLEYSLDESCQWATWRCKHGAHQSDRVRLLALLKYGGLYQDTDSFMLRNCDHLAELDGCALPRVVKTLANGFIYSQAGSAWLQGVFDEIDQLGATLGTDPAKAWAKSGTTLYSRRLRKDKAGCTVLKGELYICSKWLQHDIDFLTGPLTDEGKRRISAANVVHAIMQSQWGPKGRMTKASFLADPAPGSTFEYAYSLAKLIAEGKQDAAQAILDGVSRS